MAKTWSNNTFIPNTRNVKDIRLADCKTSIKLHKIFCISMLFIYYWGSPFYLYMERDREREGFNSR